MISKYSLLLAIALLLPAGLDAQQAPGAQKITVRAVLHDPVNPAAELFMPDDAGKIAKLNLVPANLSQAQATVPVNGSLVLYKSAMVDPKNPQASVAASVKVSGNIKKAILLIVTAGSNANPPYRMVLLDDSPSGFPKGECRVLNLIPADTAVEAGEHKLPVKPGTLVAVPAVKKKNEFNMAQTNFYMKEGENWTPITERQLQFLDEFRRIFIIHTTPGSNQPFVATIVDTAVAAPPVVPN